MACCRVEWPYGAHGESLQEACGSGRRCSPRPPPGKPSTIPCTPELVPSVGPSGTAWEGRGGLRRTRDCKSEQSCANYSRNESPLFPTGLATTFADPLKAYFAEPLGGHSPRSSVWRFASASRHAGTGGDPTMAMRHGVWGGAPRSCENVCYPGMVTYHKIYSPHLKIAHHPCLPEILRHPEDGEHHLEIAADLEMRGVILRWLPISRWAAYLEIGSYPGMRDPC